jgi:hypothetical protein
LLATGCADAKKNATSGIFDNRLIDNVIPIGKLTAYIWNGRVRLSPRGFKPSLAVVGIVPSGLKFRRDVKISAPGVVPT